MEGAFYDVLRKVPGPDAKHRGTVRISITEGLGIYWVMPRLVGFAQQHPSLLVDLRCAMESADVLRMVRNSGTPRIEVNPETFAVTVDGKHATVAPAKTIALNQKYFFS